MNNKIKIQRIQGLDIFRGLAILLMVSYHFIFDLNYFRFITVEMNHTFGFLVFRYTIMSMFLLSVGISLALVHQHYIKWKSIRKRILLLGLASLAVSIATYIVFPKSWVYFGILHFVLLASLLVLPLLKFPKITLVISIAILLGSFTKILHMHGLFALLQAPLSLPKIYSQDLVPLFPWLGIVLLGVLIVQYNYHEKIFNHKIFMRDGSFSKLLKKMGQNSLLIYLIHQPILFGAFELYFRFFSK